MENQTQRDKRLLFVGSYSPADREGIHLYEFDGKTGSLAHLGSHAGVENPSFLAVDPQRHRLYAVSEIAEGAVVALQYDPATGQMREINRQPVHGASPCHISFNGEKTLLYYANYLGGFGALPIRADGSLGPVAGQGHHKGPSRIVRERQDMPHPHSIFQVPDTPYCLVCDLGTDKVYTYEWLEGESRFRRRSETKLRPGAGPRHLAFHPTKPFVFVIEELGSAISSFRLNRNTGELRPLHTVSTLPEEARGMENLCAEVVVSPDGKYVYGSNRGHDSIAAFRISDAGMLERLGHVPSGGRTPRNFNITPDGKHLLAANQDTDNIVVMQIQENGLPQRTDREYKVSRPVCLKFA